MSTLRVMKCFSLLPYLLAAGFLFSPPDLSAVGLGDLFVSKVPISFQHPPDLGFTVDSVAFADSSGECSGEFVDLLIETFISSEVEVIERERFEMILEEIDLSASGYVRSEDVKPLGEIMGASALVFVDVQRCETKCKRSHKTYTGKNGSSTTYFATTSSHFKSSVRVVDTLTGRIHSAKVVEENKEDTNSSRDGYPEYPDTYAMKDLAIRSGVTKVHRMLLPWWELRELRFFKDKKCGMQQAFQQIEIGDHEAALQRALASLEACKALPKAKPKLLARAHYNVGVVHLLARHHEAALAAFRQAHSIRPAGRMQEGVTETQRAIRLADAMGVFQATNADRLAGGSARPASGAQPSLSHLASASRQPSKRDPAVTESSGLGERSMTQRLRELEELRREELITESEYQEMRQEVLGGLRAGS